MIRRAKSPTQPTCRSSRVPRPRLVGTAGVEPRSEPHSRGLQLSWLDRPVYNMQNGKVHTQHGSKSICSISCEIRHPVVRSPRTTTQSRRCQVSARTSLGFCGIQLNPTPQLQSTRHRLGYIRTVKTSCAASKTSKAGERDGTIKKVCAFDTEVGTYFHQYSRSSLF